MVPQTPLILLITASSYEQWAAATQIIAKVLYTKKESLNPLSAIILNHFSIAIGVRGLERFIGPHHRHQILSLA